MHAQAAGPTAPVRSLPSALEELPSILKALGTDPPRLFLDFDGTLSEIVDDPENAALAPGLGRVLERLADRIPLAFVSGRGRSDVEQRVRVRRAAYAGSHGLDIRGPDFAHRVGVEASAALSRILPGVLALADDFPGVRVEEKTLGVAVHFRGAGDVRSDELESALSRLAKDEDTLRLIQGKKVFELRPALTWNKGDAVRWLLDRPEFNRDSGRPIYIGDDLTDEDGLAVVRDHGIGIVVRGEDDTRETVAHFALANPGEVARFLERLAAHVDPR